MSHAEATATESTADRTRFYGWRMVGVAFFAMLLSGMAMSSVGNLVLPLSEAFGVGRGTISLAVPSMIAVMGLLSPFVGRLVDRGHARTLMAAGTVIAGVGALLLSRSDGLAELALIFAGPVCLGLALFGAMPCSTVVANWFVRRRGLALGVTFAGATVAGYLGPLTIQTLVDSGGWRTAALGYGVLLIAVGAPVIALLTIGRPEEVGQHPDGDPAPKGHAAGSAVPVGQLRPVSELMRDKRLWLAALGFGLILTSPVVMLTLLVPYGLDLGFSAQQANLFFAASAPFSLFGKLLFGARADVAPAKPTIALIVILNMLIWVILASRPAYPVFLAGGVLYGLGIGGAAPVQGVVMGRLFGRANFGSASGIGGLLGVSLLVIASTVSSLVQGDGGEGYPMIFRAMIGLVAVGGVLLTLLKIPEAADEPA